MKSIVKLLLLSALVFFFQPPTQAQQLDSLKAELAKANLQNDLQQFSILKKITTTYTYADLDSAIHYANIMIRYAEKGSDQLTIAKAYNTLSDVYNMNGQYREALSPLETSLKICKELNSVKGLTVNTFLKGNILQNLHKYQEAEESYLQSLKLAKTNKDSMMINNNMQGLGMNSDYMGNMDKAIEYYFEAIAIATKINDKYGLASTYTNIGNIYEDNQQIEKAKSYLQKAIQIKKELKNYAGLATTYYNITTVYLNQDDLDQASSFVDSTLRYAGISNSHKMMTYAYQANGNIYAQQGELEQALASYQQALKYANQIEDSFLNAILTEKQGIIYYKKGLHQKAQFLLEQSLRYYRSIENMDAERSTLLSCINSLEKTGDYKKAAEYYRRVVVIKDSIYNEQKIAAINEIEAKYQNEKKEAENQLLKSKSEIQAATIQSQRTTLIGSIIGVGLLALVAFLFYKQSHVQKKTNLLLTDKNQKIETLHRELSHRVKNNLSFISGLMQLQGTRLETPEAKRAVKEGENRIEAISLLHRKLYLQEEETTIDIGTYLEELCGNLSNTYPFEGATPDINLEAENIQIDGETAVRIGLIINELVTNSFKYAFSSQPEPNIDIQLNKTTSNQYQLYYKDNGKGLPPDMDIAHTRSLGLKLVQMLSKQLNGKLQVLNEAGAHFKIDFTNPKVNI